MNVNILVPRIEKFHRGSQTENYNFFRKRFNDFCQILVIYGDHVLEPSCIGGIFMKMTVLSVYDEVHAVSFYSQSFHVDGCWDKSKTLSSLLIFSE
jgi:hypothetical protein